MVLPLGEDRGVFTLRQCIGIILRQMIPIRFLFRSRWAALAWAGSICLTAVNFASEHKVATVDAGKAPAGNAAQASALNAEDPE